MAVPDGQQALSGTASRSKPGFGRVFYWPHNSNQMNEPT